MTRSPEQSAAGAIARRHDPDRFLAALFAPSHHRDAIMALVAFNHELARALDIAAAARGEHSLMGGHVRLQFWRDRIDSGDPADDGLTDILRDGRVARGTLAGMIDARQSELEGFTNGADFETALLAGPGGLARAVAETLCVDPALHDAVAAQGAAYAIGKILRHRPTLIALGRRPMPDAFLHEKHPSRAIAMAARFLGDRIRLPRHQRTAILTPVLARRDLARAARRVPQDHPRGLADRLAVTIAALS
jgi:phytoene synthase